MKKFYDKRICAKSRFFSSLLRKASLAAVLPDTHPLATRKIIKLKELSNDNFITFSKRNYLERFEALHRICKKAGFIPSVYDEADSLAATIALVGIGKGVTLLPEEFNRWPHPNVVYVRLNNPPNLDAVAVYRKSEKNPLITDLINTVRGHFLHSRREPIIKV